MNGLQATFYEQTILKYEHIEYNLPLIYLILVGELHWVTISNLAFDSSTTNVYHSLPPSTSKHTQKHTRNFWKCKGKHATFWFPNSRWLWFVCFFCTAGLVYWVNTVLFQIWRSENAGASNKLPSRWQNGCFHKQRNFFLWKAASDPLKKSYSFFCVFAKWHEPKDEPNCTK